MLIVLYIAPIPDSGLPRDSPRAEVELMHATPHDTEVTVEAPCCVYVPYARTCS